MAQPRVNRPDPPPETRPPNSPPAESPPAESPPEGPQAEGPYPGGPYPEARPGTGRGPRKMGFYDAGGTRPTTQRDPWLKPEQGRPAGPSAGWRAVIPAILLVVLILIVLSLLWP